MEEKPMTAGELRKKLDNIEHAAKRARIERPGLYIMILIILIKGCSIETDIDGVKTKLNGLGGVSSTKITVTK